MRRLPITLLAMTAFSALPMLASAEVYQYRDAAGRVYFTDRPMAGRYDLVKRFAMPGVGDARKGAPSKTLAKRAAQWDAMIARTARAHALQPALVHAVVRAESAYQVDATSKKGAMGLMQLMPATAARFGVRDAYDPQQNLQGGAQYLSQLLEMFDQDLRLALAAYNAGENAVLKYGSRIPPYPETQRYVEKVLSFYRQRRGIEQNG